MVELVAAGRAPRRAAARARSGRAVVRGREEVVACSTARTTACSSSSGPCSVHDPKAALDYARRLGAAAASLSDDLLVAMRVYFEKPRTTIGWKGLINDPHLDGSGDVNAGLRIARELLLEVLDLGLPVGCEFLDPITPQYIADTVAWGAIGARTTESQTHRQLGSGLSMPIGFKNRTDGNVQVAVDAVRAARRRTPSPASTTPARRRSSTRPATPTATSSCAAATGCRTTTCREVEDALVTLGVAGLPERLIIDASHDNSGKDPERQPLVAGDIGEQVAAGNGAIVGVMLESFLVAGRQDLGPGDTHLRPVDHRRLPRLGGTAVIAGPARRAVEARRSDRGGDEVAVLGVGLIGGSIGLAARQRLRRRGRRLRPRPRRRSSARVELGALDRAAARSPRPARAPRWSSARPGRRAAGAGARGAGGERPGRRGHRRRLDQGRAGRGARRPTSASSAATRWPGPRPPESRTPAPTSSRAPAGT